MLHEPPIDRPRLLDAVRAAYALPATALDFIPVGYATACYALHTETGERFFLKLWPDTHAGRYGAARLGITLPLLRAIDERIPDLRVPAPIETRDGALSAMFESLPFALFPYLPGRSSPDPAAPALARTLAAVHRATPLLADVLPPRETFDIPFEAGLRRGLDALDRIEPDAGPAVIALRDRMLPRRGEVLTQLARLRDLRRLVRRLPGPRILCHRDFGGDNVLVDDDGTVAVLDWDSAAVAPPEHDLWIAAGDGFDRFLAAYRDAGGAGPLHLDQFAFALLSRHLADMTARLLRILEEETTPAEDDDALEGIEEWGFDQWRALDQTLATIGTALQHDGR